MSAWTHLLTQRSQCWAVCTTDVPSPREGMRVRSLRAALVCAVDRESASVSTTAYTQQSSQAKGCLATTRVMKLFTRQIQPRCTTSRAKPGARRRCGCSCGRGGWRAHGGSQGFCVRISPSAGRSKWLGAGGGGGSHPHYLSL